MEAKQENMWLSQTMQEENLRGEDSVFHNNNMQFCYTFL